MCRLRRDCSDMAEEDLADATSVAFSLTDKLRKIKSPNLQSQQHVRSFSTTVGRV